MSVAKFLFSGTKTPDEFALEECEIFKVSNLIKPEEII